MTKNTFFHIHFCTSCLFFWHFFTFFNIYFLCETYAVGDGRRFLGTANGRSKRQHCTKRCICKECNTTTTLPTFATNSFCFCEWEGRVGTIVHSTAPLQHDITILAIGIVAFNYRYLPSRTSPPTFYHSLPNNCWVLLPLLYMLSLKGTVYPKILI